MSPEIIKHMDTEPEGLEGQQQSTRGEWDNTFKM